MENLDIRYRTNFFDFGDTNLIEEVGKRHNVGVTSNMKGIALVAEDLNELLDTVKESFNNNVKIRVRDDIVFVNL